MRRAALLLATAALVSCGGSDAGPKLTKVASFPGSLVEADGHQVYFDCQGTGSPTVVFLSGWGSESADWLNIFDHVKQRTRTCEYDRGEVGVTAAYGSALPRKGRDAHDQVHELEQLIDNADIPKPYVLVGHSWGGALARLYAGTHDDVKAVVFVDSASPGQDAAIQAALPPKRADEPALLTQLRHPAAADPVLNPEYLDWRKSLQEVATVEDLGDLPVVVLTAGNDFGEGTRYLLPVWLRLQDRIARLSTRSIHVLAPTSSHFVQLDEPDVTTAAVDAAVEAARDDGKLASCAAIFAHVRGGHCVGGG